MAPNNELPPGDFADGQISKSVLGCLASFRQLMSTQDKFATPTLLPTIRDEETRFKVWSGNIGAHKRGRSSLQYRLRDASHLQKQVLGLLAELTTLLEDAIAIVQGNKIPWEMLDEGPLREEEEEKDGIPDTELGQITTDVVEVVNCLLRLSVSIRNPAPHDQFKSSAGNITRYYEEFDIQHVRSKFGSVNDTIARRLGKTISKRREYFRYREGHHAKLSQGLESNLPDEDLESTVASDIPHQMKAPYIDEDKSSITNLSETSFASSVGTTDKLRIPPLPIDANKGPFECPFCFMMIAATNTKSWKRHVYADLRPYVCLSEDCQTPEYQFDRRRDWIQHELQNHWKIYTCPFACSEIPKLSSATALRAHLNNKHKGNVSAGQLDALIDLSARPLRFEDGIDCCLCGQRFFSIRTYRRHVGCHQEQISLFALPSLTHDDGVEGPENEWSTSSDDEVERSDDVAPDAPEPRGVVAQQAIDSSNVSITSLGSTDTPTLLIPTPGHKLSVNEFLRTLPDDDDQSHSRDQPISYASDRIDHDKSSEENKYQPHLDPEGDTISEIITHENMYPSLSISPPDRVVFNPSLRSETLTFWVDDIIERPRANAEDASDRVAHVVDVDESGDVIEGTDRYAESVYDPSVPSSSKEREISRGRTLIESRFQRDSSSTTKATDKESKAALLDILTQPAPQFPGEPNPIHEGVAPHKDEEPKIEVPEGARWTKISRKMVNPEALTIGKERFEVRGDFVIVLRILSKEEIQSYADATAQLRGNRKEQEAKRYWSADIPDMLQSKLSQRPTLSGPESGAPGKHAKATSFLPKDAAYYGVDPPTTTPSSSRPQRVNTVSRPPPANMRWYQNQTPQQLQQPAIGYYPSPSPPPFQVPFGHMGPPRPQAVIGFRTPTGSIPFDEDDMPEVDGRILQDEYTDEEAGGPLREHSSLTAPSSQDEKQPSRVELWEIYNKLDREKGRLESFNDPFFSSTIKELAVEMNRVRVRIANAESGSGNRG